MSGVASGKTTTVWLVVALTLASVIAVEIAGDARPGRAMTPSPPKGLPIELSVLEDARRLSPTDVDDILARPLFSPSRKPAAADAGGAPVRIAPKSLAETLTLIGVIHAEGGGVALLRAREHGVLRVKLDQKVEGWRLAGIDRDRVRLERDQEAEWLTLRKPDLGLDTFRPELAVSSVRQTGSRLD